MASREAIESAALGSPFPRSMPLQLRLLPQTVPPRLPLSSCAGSNLRASSRLRLCESLVDFRAGSESPPAFRLGTSPQAGSLQWGTSSGILSDTLLQCQSPVSELQQHRSASKSPPAFRGQASVSSRPSLGGDQPPCRCSVARSCASTCEPSGSTSPRSCSPSPRTGFAPPAPLGDQRALRRALQAELSLLDKDRQIESLEARVRELEDAACHDSRVERQSSPREGSAYATDADVEALCQKSGDLVVSLSALSLEGGVDDSETCYRTHEPACGIGMASNSGRRIAQMNAPVQQNLRRTASHTTLNLCVGPREPPPRYRRASTET